ncbi:MAG: hydroxyisourate hydrolase [Ferruginibacter sp.]|nr:hydroxyisourate hydrolase [Ferruginibacter sp.]
MGEQQKITFQRLKGIVEDFELPQSQLTTHVLDTSLGKPAQKLFVQLYHEQGNDKKAIASGLTNHDGRVPNLLPAGRILTAGEYTLRFEVNQYYNELNLQCFYPYVEISFLLKNQLHYHVPLLLNPFGYSTYRGS